MANTAKAAQFFVALILLSCASKNHSVSPEEDSIEIAKKPEEKVSARPVHWGYTGQIGPEMWAALTPVYSACGEGKKQSPVDLITSSADGQPKLTVDFKTTSLTIAHHEHVDDILDNGHTIQITVEEGSSFTLNDNTYKLKQFHFHTPSEHTIDGKHFPLEMHWVHQSDDGSFGVIGALFEEGKANENFAKIIKYMPTTPGESSHFKDVKLDLNIHIPKDLSAYHYIGSFTTPPCTENVEWLVLRNRFSMSSDQIAAFSSRLKNNNRPVQAMNNRTLTIDKIQ